MNKLDALEKLESMEWHFAASMKNIPHWYARRIEHHSPAEFLSIARFIKENGENQKFFRQTYKYLIGPHYKYWIMADNPDDVEIINRAEL